MSLTRAVAKNTIIQVVGKGVSTLLGLLVVAMIGRHLGADGFGQYTTVTTYLQFFGILVDFGLVLVTVQMISAHHTDENRVINNLFTLRFFSALVFLALAPIIAALYFPYPPVVQTGIVLTSLSFFFIALNQVLTGLFQKHLSLFWVAASENAGRVALFVGTLLAVILHKGLLAVLLAVVLGSLVQFLVLFAAAQQFVRIRFAWDWSIWREIMQHSWPIGVSIAFNLIYLRADVLLMTLYYDDAAVGFYGAAYRVVDILLMLPVMMMGVVLPILTHAWSKGEHARFGSILQRTFEIFMMIILPAVAGGWVLSSSVMAFVVGPEFSAAGPTLFILLLALFFMFVSTLFGHAVVALNHQRRVIWIYGIDAVLSLIGYLIFIPKYGAAGGAWVTVFSECFAAVVLGWHVLAHTRGRLMLGRFWRIVLSCAIMLGFLLILPAWHVLVLITVAVAIYSVCLWLTGGISREMLAQLVTRESK